ncbi:hypothetical protein PIB30_073406 [Stylosanthes scabra]|uniref:Uncharacterized protein n=1 Tax=Stylosanthes scabra TaxID=79078 RepID=A0ABU6VSS9_9FABA|nr:hypothetical protein [Stylosanthes scabra]
MDKSNPHDWEIRSCPSSFDFVDNETEIANVDDNGTDLYITVPTSQAHPSLIQNNIAAPAASKNDVARGDHHHNVCIISVSAHGTNPVNTAMCGMKIFLCEPMPRVTYSSTHGIYEEGIDEICKVSLTSPGWIGADVCHLILHKTFCIPHGGGGTVKVPSGGIPASANSQPLGTIFAASWRSVLILPFSYTYIAMMGSEGHTHNMNIPALRLKVKEPPSLFILRDMLCVGVFLLYPKFKG